MAILAPTQIITNKKEIYDAIITELKDATLIEATVVGQTNPSGQVTVSGASAKTQYDALELKANTLANEVSQLESALPVLQMGYTQLKDSDLSFVWGCRSVQSSTSNRSYTTELGSPNTSTFIDAMLSSILKIYKNSANVLLPSAQRGFKIDPAFVPSAKTDFINNPTGCDDVFLYSNTDYAGQDFMVFALKNDTGSNKTFAFDFNGSAYTTNTLLNVWQYTPNASDNAIYAGGAFTLTKTSLFNITSSSSTTDRTVNITIANGFSSIIIFQSCVKYITTNTAGRDSFVRNIKTNLEGQGLKQNANIMEIFRRVIEGKRINSVTNFNQLNILDDIFKLRCGSLIPNYATNNAALAGSEMAGNTYYNTTSKSLKIVLLEFANNAAALAGGLTAGMLYYNTTLVDEAIVV